MTDRRARARMPPSLALERGGALAPRGVLGGAGARRVPLARSRAAVRLRAPRARRGFSPNASSADVDRGASASDDGSADDTTAASPSLARRPALVALFASALAPSMDAPSALASTKDAPLVGVDRVVLKTASITPDAAADYPVRCLGLRRVTDDEDPTLAPRGRAAVRGAYGITLELRGGGDDVPEGEADAIPETSLDPPRLASVVLGSDNPAKAKNAAVRAGAASAANGERCSGDAYAGCAVTVVGFPVTFVKTSAAKGAPAVVRVGVGAGSGDAAAASARDIADEAIDRRGGAAAGGFAVLVAGQGRG